MWCSILKTVCLGSSYPATFHIFSVFKLSQLLNQLSDHTEIRTWSVFYDTKQQYTKRAYEVNRLLFKTLIRTEIEESWCSHIFSSLLILSSYFFFTVTCLFDNEYIWFVNWYHLMYQEKKKYANIRTLLFQF
jgi:hypothetical protein